jgi:hypothetical protein
MEAGRTPSAGIGGELDRIEAAVESGDTDLRRLGFWRLVAMIKRDDELVEKYADQVGRIDARAFRARFRIRPPVWLGNVLLALVLVFGFLAFAFATWKGTPNDSFEFSKPLAGLGLVVAAGAWMVGLHSSSHYVVGRLVGIRYLSYFAALPPPPLPGLKTDYASYLRASPTARAWMHASGAIATKLAPFLVLALAAAYDVSAPGWAILILWILGIGQLVTDAVFSTKASDWKKVRRELAIARARRGVPA